MNDKNNKNQESNSEDLVSFVEGLKHQWMATIDALIDPLMIVDTDYNIKKANKALASFADKKSIKAVLGKKCYEIFGDNKEPCTGCMMKESSENKEPLTFSLNNVRKEFFYEVTSQPIYDVKGQLDGLVHIYRDRTKAKQMEAQLVQSEKLASIGLLAGGVAHEINNPLGGILIFSQMLLREIPKDSPHYEDVVEIEAATQRCKSIVERLLDFARQQPTGDQEPLECVNVVEAAKTALRFGRVADQARRCEIDELWHDSDFPVMADRNKLIQVFLNLIQNAFQAMPDGGTLVLKSHVEDRVKGKFGVFEVQDTGVGIPKENLKRIFDPFFTTKDPGEGTGLGLAICYGMVQEIGGLLEVDSSVNVGTTFRLTLPLADESQQKSAS